MEEIHPYLKEESKVDASDKRYKGSLSYLIGGPP
jgi:hypothetical protein